MERIKSNEKSDYSINASTLNTYDAFSPVDDQDIRESYSVNSPNKISGNRYKLPNIKNKNNWTEDYSHNCIEEKGDNQTQSNNNSFIVEKLEMSAIDLSPSRRPHFEFSK